MSTNKEAATATTTTETDDNKNDGEGGVKPSIVIKMIRHAESENNQIYRNARYIYRGGTPEFDFLGWKAYVNEHRTADPGLSSELGQEQADALAEYIVPHLSNQAVHPVDILVSPMRRTCATIRPTVQQLGKACHVTVHGFYFESEGCHKNDVAEEGMNPTEIRDYFRNKDSNKEEDGGGGDTAADVDIVGFPTATRGWWCGKTGPETRQASEQRAAKFYLWLCEYLDQKLLCPTVFDAGVSVLPGEEHERDHDKHNVRLRRRKMQILMGHGDFMSLVLKRIVAGFGHAVETTGIPHRSAFVHWNTGITELEYFGKGRFLVMSHNSTPHLVPELLSGGSLKDGWSYLMPAAHLDTEVSVAFSDEEFDDHVLEQREALKALYMKSGDADKWTEELSKERKNPDLSVEEEENAEDRKDHVRHFVVKQGYQVVGVATYSENTGMLSDVAVRPSAGKEGVELLLNAVKEHSKKLKRSGSLLVIPRSEESKQLFQAVGFAEVTDEVQLALNIDE